MHIDDYVKIVKENIKNSNSKKIMINQIKKFFDCKNKVINIEKYKIGDEVFLKKGTLLHGTYKNIDGLKEIVNNGLISGFFMGGRLSKYPSSVGVWNLKKTIDYLNILTFIQAVQFYMQGYLRMEKIPKKIKQQSYPIVK